MTWLRGEVAKSPSYRPGVPTLFWKNLASLGVLFWCRRSAEVRPWGTLHFTKKQPKSLLAHSYGPSYTSYKYE